jgi:hypothetical protein
MLIRLDCVMHNHCAIIMTVTVMGYVVNWNLMIV